MLWAGRTVQHTAKLADIAVRRMIFQVYASKTEVCRLDSETDECELPANFSDLGAEKT
jgi:hypothetical protein